MLGPQAQNFSSKFDSDLDNFGGESGFISFCVTEANVNSCPRVDGTSGDEVIGSMVDIVADVSVI
jgi:hypothetical protein